MTQQPTGIVGNTSQQQSAATTGRQTLMKGRMFWAGNIGFAVLAVGVGVILANASLSFWWKLVVAIALIVISGKLSGIKNPAVTLWSKIIKSIGWIVLTTVLLLSGFGTWIGSAVNSAEEATTKALAASVATVKPCERNSTVRLEYGCYFTLNPGESVAMRWVDEPQRFTIQSTNPSVTMDELTSWSVTEDGPVLTSNDDSRMTVFATRDSDDGAEVAEIRDAVKQATTTPLESALQGVVITQ